jgi:hypothetical protein
MMRVTVLDTVWQWATPRPCAAIHDGPVWIRAAGISRDYPSPSSNTR